MNSSKENKILPASKCCLILAFDSLNEWFEEIKIRVWERFFFSIAPNRKNFTGNAWENDWKEKKITQNFRKLLYFSQFLFFFFFMNKTCFLAPGFKSTKITWLYPLIYTFEKKKSFKKLREKGCGFY